MLQEVINREAQRLERLRETLQETSQLLADSAANVKGLGKTDPTPTKFVGVIDGYRFTTGPKGQVPSHRFEVLCGNGLYLHVEATPEQFGQMMTDMDMGDIKPSKINMRLVIVTRTENGTVPERMIEFPPLEAQDRWGNYLWQGAPVLFEGETVAVAGDGGEADGRYVVVLEDTTRRFADRLTLAL